MKLVLEAKLPTLIHAKHLTAATGRREVYQRVQRVATLLANDNIKCISSGPPLMRSRTPTASDTGVLLDLALSRRC